MHFNIIKSGSDCTNLYKVSLDKEYTVQEFLDEAFSIRKNEWGSISIYNKEIKIGCSYSKSQIPYIQIPKDVLTKKIKDVSATGGWSNMNYDIKLQDEYTLTDKDKELILNTVKTTVEMMHNKYSFRKYLEALGLESSDYSKLYSAGGMVLTNVSSMLDDLNIEI